MRAIVALLGLLALPALAQDFPTLKPGLSRFTKNALIPR